MTLYEIDRRITNCINKETGEIDFETFKQMQMEKENKIEGILLWLKDLKAEAIALKNEIDSLQERKESAEKRAESIKQFLSEYLNGERFKTPKVSVNYRNTRSVEVDDIFKIPEQYLKYTAPTADRVQLKKDIDAFGEIPGCHIEEKKSMIIK